MANQNPARVDSNLTSKIVFRKKTSAFAITFASLCLLMFTFWSMSVDRFVSKSTVRLAILSPGSFDSVELETRVLHTWDQQLEDEHLAMQIVKLGDSSRSEHSLLLGESFDRLRESLGQVVVPNPDGRTVDVHITLAGDGSRAEGALVDQLAKDFASRISTPLRSTSGHIKEMFSDTSVRLCETQQGNLDRLALQVEQIGSDINLVQTVISEHEALGQPTDNPMTERPMAEVSEPSVGPQTSLLNQKLEALLERHSNLNLNDREASIKEVNQLKQDIALVRLEILELEENEIPSAPLLHFVKNPMAVASSSPSPFIKASHSRTTTWLENINGALDSIDIMSLKSTIAQVRSTREEQTSLHQQYIAAMTSETASRAAGFVVQGISASRSRPLGGMPSTATVVTILLLSASVASVVSWRYLPLQDGARFKTADQVACKLNLPVLASLHRRAEDDEIDDDLPVSNLVVQLARVVLLSILVVIIGGLLVSPSIRNSFMDNPLYGLTHIMWNILGK